MTNRPNLIEMVLSAADVAHRLSYDEKTGVLTFNRKIGDDRLTNSWNARFAGKVTGCLSTSGYLDVCLTVDGRPYLVRAHRLIWAIKTGEWLSSEYDVDHINGNRADNRWINLRKSVRFQNGRNRKQSTANTSGFKGVVRNYESKTGQRWIAQLRVGGKSLYLGYFDNPVDAAIAYDQAAVVHHGEFARTNKSLGLL